MTAYVVRCAEFCSPEYGTRSEAEEHLCSIVSWGACEREHRVEQRSVLTVRASPSVVRAWEQWAARKVSRPSW